jgi:hypothetical protein
MSYADPNFNVRREAAFITVAGATTEGAKFRSFQKIKLKKVHFAVITAGAAGTHGYRVYHGATAIGANVVLGTAAAGTTGATATLDEVVGSMEQISVKSLDDITGVAHVVYEYEVEHDAVQTV